MTTETKDLSIIQPHPLSDEKLNSLNSFLLEMIDLLIYQLEQALHALDYCDMDLALKAVARDRKVNHYQIKIDAEVLSVLEEQNRVEENLLKIIFTGRIAGELEEIGNLLVELVKYFMALFDTSDMGPRINLITDIFKIGNLVKIMLDKAMDVLEIKDSDQAYSLLEYVRFCTLELQESMKQQIEFIKNNSALTQIMVSIMQIMQILDRCREHCGKIAEYLIFMIEGIDVRHYSVSAVNKNRKANSCPKTDYDLCLAYR